MQILLQNRRAFYAAVLPRIPDPQLREKLADIAESGDVSLDDYSEVSHNNLIRLDLVDFACKPEAGVKSGKTAISVDEVLSLAIRFEELVLLACRASDAFARPELIKNIESKAVDRLNRLLLLNDSLRYHRFRLTASSL